MIEGKFLPIGTVVILKGGLKKVMISGFLSSSKENTGKVYDYTGCVYPEGFLSSDKFLLFDHEQIEKVFFKGFVDEEEEAFKKKLDALAATVTKVDAPTTAQAAGTQQQ